MDLGIIKLTGYIQDIELSPLYAILCEILTGDKIKNLEELNNISSVT